MILSRVKISPQQRYDLEDFLAQQAAARADALYWTKTFLNDTNLIMGGFTVSGLGLTQATVAMTNAALIIPQSTFDFSYFVSAVGDPDLTLTDADLVDGVRNYVEAQLATLDGTPLVKAFWDPEANSGLGAEFNQIVDTVTDLKVELVVSQGGFSGDSDKLPIAIIDTDGSGVIKVLLDRRELYGRLGKPGNIDYAYNWGTRIEPVYSLNMTGAVGVFVAGETITIGSETATVVTGGTANITFNCPSGINFENGDSVTGGTSGATGTVNTILESFLGVDKNLQSQKDINDALASEIRGVKGTRFWWQLAPTTGGMKQELMSAIAPISSGAKVVWSGTHLRITDSDLTPATTDDIAAIRCFNSTANLMLRRQDDGKEVVTVTLDEVPDDGILTLDQDANLIPINWDDTASDIQTTWNASGAFLATVTGSPAEKRFVIKANSAGLQVDTIVDSNTLEKSGSPVTPTIQIKQGLASDSSIAIADGEVLYVDLPSPLVSTNYSGVGAGSTNYKVAARGSISLVDSVYWLAYREGSKLVWRFSGELQAGEDSEISDNVPQTLLDAIGLASETSFPSYDSNIRGVANESIVARVSKLTDAIGDEQEDRSGYIRSDDTVTWDGTDLTFTEDLVVEFINTKSGVVSQHVVEVTESPISLADNESAWIMVDRSLTSQVCTLKYSGVDPIPAQTQPYKDVFVLFRRHDSLGSGYLYVPFHKQVIEPGQTVRLGATGSGSGSSTTGRAGEEAVSSGVTTHTIVFSSPLLTDDYSPKASWVNTTDSDPDIQSLVVTAKTVNGFTVKWNAPTDSANYKLSYIVPGSQTQMVEWPLALNDGQATVTLPIPLANTMYAAVVQFVNMVDGSPQFQDAVVTAKATNSVTAKWNADVDSGNYRLAVQVMYYV